MIESELLSIKVRLKIGQKEYLLLILCRKLILGLVNERFKQRKNKFLFKKNCGWGSYKWLIIQNQTVILDRDKVKVVLDLSNYATKKGIEHATGVDTSNLTAVKDFIALEAEVDSTANKDWSTVNYCQSLAFGHPYLSCNDHCDQMVFQEICFLLLLLE